MYILIRLSILQISNRIKAGSRYLHSNDRLARTEQVSAEL